MWRWRRLEKTSGTDHVNNEEVLRVVKEEGDILRTVIEERITGLVTSSVGTAV
jgi:hypothetical protein